MAQGRGNVAGAVPVIPISDIGKRARSDKSRLCMILEGIVTTISAAGAVNIAPMGPHVDETMQRSVLRPFPTAQTYQNLRAHGEGVLHVTDDVLLLARAAIGKVEPPPPLIPAQKVRGFVLADACRYYEFKVRSVDTSAPRVRIEAEVVHQGRLRD